MNVVKYQSNPEIMNVSQHVVVLLVFQHCSCLCVHTVWLPVHPHQSLFGDINVCCQVFKKIEMLFPQNSGGMPGGPPGGMPGGMPGQ